MRDQEGRRGGGVAILHRTEITAKPLAMPNSGPLETLGVCDLERRPARHRGSNLPAPLMSGICES